MNDITKISAYILSLKHAKFLLQKGLITIEAYDNFDTKLRQKYGISDSSIFRIKP